MSAVYKERVLHDDLRDVPDADADRAAFLDAQNVYIELGELKPAGTKGAKRIDKPGQVCAIYRDELGWIACVATNHAFTLDHEFPTLRQAIDFAMEKAGL